MRCPLSRTLPALGAIIILSFLPGGSVLCLGPCGHVALEARSAPCSLAELGSSARTEPVSLGHAHGCVDIPLPTSVLLRVAPAAGSASLFCLALFAPAPVELCLATARQTLWAAQDPPAFDTRLAQLKTKILRV